MNQDFDKLFHFAYQDNGAEKTLFLLPGTGASETDLFPLVEPLQTQYNFLGLRGNVNEHGLTRFFVRTALGVFDQESIREETAKLAVFLQKWSEKTAMSLETAAFLGYSNGANMILAMLFSYPHLVHKAAVLHSMAPFVPDENLSLKGKRVLVTYGERDRMISAEESKKAIDVLHERGCEVTAWGHQGGHEISRDEIETVHRFFKL